MKVNLLVLASAKLQKFNDKKISDEHWAYILIVFYNSL